jgi:hypothetical protein
MATNRVWDRAASLPVPANDRRAAEVAVLAAGLPDVAGLFTFMRDAELRFQTLRLRIEETASTTRGQHLSIIETMLRHPGQARVTTSEPSRGTAANYEIWISDGEIVRTYSAPNKLGTQRPVRRPVVGLEDPDLPGMSTVYRAVTALPMESLPETFIHPAGFCQNVLATGRCWIAGTTDVADREAILVECDHPRTTEVATDRADHHFQVAVDRETGVISRLVETVGGLLTRDAIATSLIPDAPLPPSAFVFAFPTGTNVIY